MKECSAGGMPMYPLPPMGLSCIRRGIMHPDLLNNAVFLRYYKQWQEDPSSIVFAPIAEFFLKYGMINEAQKICREGLKKQPTLVSGRLAMAKIHLRRGNWEEAEEELRVAFAIMPKNRTAETLLEEIGQMRHQERTTAKEPPSEHAFMPLAQPPAPEAPRREIGPSWQTVTMAGIYAAQGHVDQARHIYESILESDPANEAAQQGLAALSSTGT